ncbi:hypothetical protein FOCC_FOCC007996 [Frankliniella occidentalis]|nr:hypothetical protein FOCC_FOCC007996 [Frankliniella occidentalis]
MGCVNATMGWRDCSRHADVLTVQTHLEVGRAVIQELQHVPDVVRVLDDEVELHVELAAHQLSTHTEKVFDKDASGLWPAAATQAAGDEPAAEEGEDDEEEDQEEDEGDKRDEAEEEDQEDEDAKRDKAEEEDLEEDEDAKRDEAEGGGHKTLVLLSKDDQLLAALRDTFIFVEDPAGAAAPWEEVTSVNEGNLLTANTARNRTLLAGDKEEVLPRVCVREPRVEEQAGLRSEVRNPSRVLSYLLLSRVTFP